MKIRRRMCDNPAPSHGGSYCPGNSTNSAPCNRKHCPGNVNNKLNKLLNKSINLR